MNNKVDPATREHFRDWLRERLREHEFYQRRGDHFLIREFAKYCQEREAPIDEASLGRYINRDDPVLPTPDRCRALARVLNISPLRVLAHAGYLTSADFDGMLPATLAPDRLADMLQNALAAYDGADSTDSESEG